MNCPVCGAPAAGEHDGKVVGVLPYAGGTCSKRCAREVYRAEQLTKALQAIMGSAQATSEMVERKGPNPALVHLLRFPDQVHCGAEGQIEGLKTTREPAEVTCDNCKLNPHYGFWARSQEYEAKGNA